LPSQLEEAEIDFVGVARTPKDTNLIRAGAVVRRLLLWCFRNRETGAITVAQTLNLALSVFLVAILWLGHPNGAISTVAKVVATGSLIVWALDESLLYEFRLEAYVPAGHMLRAIDRFVDLSDLRRHLAPFYSSMGRPSVDPELMIRMLLDDMAAQDWGNA
jgi:hypothetical protein